MDSSLPLDLIINILLKLPVKSLGKFKSVSKKWLELITDPHFITTHRELRLRHPKILLVKENPPFEDSHMRKCTKIDFCTLSSDGFCKNSEFSLHLYNEDNIQMLPSKGGLIFLMCEIGFYVCNPSTHVMVKLPVANACIWSRESAAVGYIKERDEYVLVHVFDRCDDEDSSDFGCEVLRLRDGMDCSWKVLDGGDYPCVEGLGVSVENVFYWMDWDGKRIPEEEEGAIVSFDLGKEEFNTLPLPEECIVPYNFWLLAELGGRLCLAVNAAGQPIMDIWELTDIENREWVKEYSIPMVAHTYRMLDYIVPFDYRDGKLWMYDKRDGFAYYDTKEKCTERMDHLIARGWKWVSVYTESLFSLNQIDA